MEVLYISCSGFIFDLMTILSFFVASIIAIGYFFRPWLRLSDYSLDTNELFKVKLENHNMRTIPEIKCEIATSDTLNFDLLNTQDPVIDSIMFLARTPRNYFFKSHLKHKKKIIRVRILAPNFLGVKKAYETVYHVNRENENHYELTIERERGYHLL